MSDEQVSRTRNDSANVEQQPNANATTRMPDDAVPSLERQAALRAAYGQNVAMGKAPYAGVSILTRGELTWVMQERQWSGALLLPEGYGRADLTDADLSLANLADVALGEATLTRADLGGAVLDGAFLRRTNLTDVNLRTARLVGADLRVAALVGADLREADLTSADLRVANLSGADMRLACLDARTTLVRARLDARTCVADVVWNGVPVTRLNWEDIPRLGDEWAARQFRDEQGKPKDAATRLSEYQGAVMANLQVATVLRDQGLSAVADRFAYRAQILQQVVLAKQRRMAAYLGSWLLDVLVGFGYKPARLFLAYVYIVIAYAGAYFATAATTKHPLSWSGALLQSVAVFSQQPFSQLASAATNSPVLAELESTEIVCGILITFLIASVFGQRLGAK